MTLETLFWSFALLGTAFFALRATLIFTGLGHDSADIYHDVDSASGTEGSFKIISITTLLAFAAAFGWTGLAALNEFRFPPVLAIIVAGAIAALVMVGVAYLFKTLIGLETLGISYKIEEAVGKSATVYEQIPANGQGVIQVSFSGMLREVAARAENLTEIPSGAPVIVVRVVDERSVSVRRQ